MYPVEFYTATTLYPQTFGAFLLVTIMLLLFGKDVFSAKRTMIAGLVAGILVLAIPSFLLALPLVLVCMLIINKDGIGVLSKHCLILLGCTVLVVAPWTLRNAHVFNAFIPLSTNSGINLLLGNSENTEPNMGMNVDVSRYVEDAKGMGYG